MKKFKELFRIKRYFIVCYVGTIDKSHVTGHIDFTTSGSFINRKLTSDLISDRIDGIKDIVVTNIIELTKSDYKSWNSN